MVSDRRALLGIAAWSGTGKTTLLERLVPLLVASGVRLAVIKHAHHEFDIDHPGKDSHRLRQAGAEQVMVASRRRWALMTERRDDRDDPPLDELLAHLDPSIDLVLVEGFKHERFAKIELHRPSLGRPLLYPDDPTVIAVASDAPLPVAPPLPLLDLNDPARIAAFVLDWLRREKGR